GRSNSVIEGKDVLFFLHNSIFSNRIISYRFCLEKIKPVVILSIVIPIDDGVLKLMGLEQVERNQNKGNNEQDPAKFMLSQDFKKHSGLQCKDCIEVNVNPLTK